MPQFLKLSILALLCCSGLGFGGIATHAQAPVKDPLAEEVLKRVASHYRPIQVYKIAFTRKTEDVAGKVVETQQGTLTVAKEKFRLDMPEVKLLCDGKNLYSYVVASKEINLTTYAPNPDDITPRDVFNLYQTGYKYFFWAELKTPTGLVQLIDLEPEDINKDIAKVRLVIDKKTATVRKYILTERGTNTKISFTLNRFTARPPLAAGYFTYKKSTFAGGKLIDLR